MRPFILASAIGVLLIASAPGDKVAAEASSGADSRTVLPVCGADRWIECRESIPGAAPDAVVLGGDLDGDGDADEVTIRLEVDEIQEEVYPGKFVTFWVFAPPGDGMLSPARAPSPTIRVEEGDRVRIILENTHYFPHTIHLHGTIHPNAMDGVPDFTQAAVRPGHSFTYEFVARHPGTFFYHCHVQPDVHVLMGLAGMLIIEPNRPNNRFHHLVLGAGRMPEVAAGERERGYAAEYSLVYQDIDDRLNRIPSLYKDPLAIERAMDRDYDVTQRRPDVFLLNGRSFPYTLRDTPIRVTSGERVLLRVLNAGERVVHLHAHGHHVIVVARDGYELPAAAREVRDVVTVGPAQRVDLELRPGDDGVYASGPGVWIMHDHTERATTNHGISPGGDMTAIIYDGFEGPDGLPRVATDLARYFDPGYYQGKVPVFDPEIYHEKGMADAPLAPGASYPRRDDANDESRRPDLMESHRIVARSCTSPKGVRRVRISEGTQAAGPGAVYGFAPNVIHVAPCETVEIALENTDQIRHDVMIPGLDPMFTLDFRGPGREAGHFVTPDHDVTLEFHCHVPGHEAIGMRGLIIVGKGSPGTESMVAALHHATTGAAAAASSVSTAPAGHEAVGSGASTASAKHLYEGVGVLKSVDPRSGRIIIDHKEIPGFMAAMTMSYLVDPADLVKGLKPGEGVDFTIDSDKREIVAIRPTAR